jgi:hypothetical protein
MFVSQVGRVTRILALTVGIVASLLTIALVWCESRWDEKNQPPEDGIHAFVEGTVGTELAPEVVLAVLPELFPDEFHPVDSFLKAEGVSAPSAGDWIDQFGFIRKSDAPPPNDQSPFPVGFVRSYHRPGGGGPSPVPFVALSCAACHSAEIRTSPDKAGVVLYGVGNPSMNLLAFSEAVRAVLLKREGPEGSSPQYTLTLEKVRNKWAEKGRTLTWTEEAIILVWLGGARTEIGGYQRVIDEPCRAEQLADPRFVLAGPARTQPFRSLIRVHLDRPGMWALESQMDQGFSKIPVVFHQAPEYRGRWAQFDGSVDNVLARSTLAASTAGGNVHNLSLPDISQNIIQAARYTESLPSIAWEDAFGREFPIDRKLAGAGRAVYAEYCLRCHGEPLVEGGKHYWTWNKGDAAPGLKFGDIVPLAQIGTDGSRVQYRHKNSAAGRIADEFGDDFRKKHPLGSFTASDLRAPDGYLNGPISGAFLRAPYLHNASILTLAELIGLERRRDYFYRGRNAYDPVRVGYASPEVPLDKDGPPSSARPHDQHYYFLFDTRVRGNSNKGHEFPGWAFDPARPPTDAQRQQLRALLEYLKTL